jgi:hypothetical protein
VKTLTHDDVTDIAVRIVNQLVQQGFVPDCNDTDDETEFAIQDLIRAEIVSTLSL